MNVRNQRIQQIRNDVQGVYQQETKANYAQYANRVVHLADKDYLNRVIFFQIAQYRSLSDLKAEKEFMKQKFIQLVNSVECMLIRLVFENHTVALQYGFQVTYHDYKALLQSCFKDIQFTSIKHNEACPNQGEIIGSFENVDLDQIIPSLINMNGTLTFVIRRVSNMDKYNEIHRLTTLANRFSHAESVSYGNNYHYNSKDSNVTNLLQLLNSQIEYYSSSSICDVQCYFSVKQANQFTYFADGIKSGLVSQFNELVAIRLERDERIFTNRYFHCYRNIEDTANFMIAPMQSYNGLSVYKAERNEYDLQVFDSKQPDFIYQTDLYLGSDSFGKDYFMPSLYINQHMYISGMSGTGKTVFLLNILKQLANYYNITVIEASKTEHYEAYQYIPHLKVYSVGRNGLDIKINLFQPENGTLMAKHVSFLKGALLSLFDDESPLPQVLNNYIYYLYEKHHISMNDFARYDYDYPTLKEMIEGIQKYMEEETTYEKKIKDNIASCIYTRLQSVLYSPLNSILDTKKSTGIERIMKGYSVIELNDAASEDRNFMIFLFTNLMSEYLYNQPSQGLKNIIVMEEAHSILVDPTRHNLKASRIESSELYANMLRETRALGCGFIISDQRPSDINSAVIGNSDTKITFSLSENKDIETLKYPFNLSDYQSKNIRNLNRGDCLVSINGYKEVNQIHYPYQEQRKTRHLGCLFCDQGCSKRVDLSYLPEYPYLVRRIVGLTGQRLKQQIDDLQTDNPICTLGSILEDTTLNNNLKRRKLYDYIHADEVK